MSNIKSILVFANGNVAVFNKQGKQVAKYQNPLIHYDNIRKLVDLCVKNDVEPEIQGGEVYDFRTEVSRRLQHAKRTTSAPQIVEKDKI